MLQRLPAWLHGGMGDTSHGEPSQVRFWSSSNIAGSHSDQGMSHDSDKVVILLESPFSARGVVPDSPPDGTCSLSVLLFGALAAKASLLVCEKSLPLSDDFTNRYMKLYEYMNDAPSRELTVSFGAVTGVVVRLSSFRPMVKCSCEWWKVAYSWRTSSICLRASCRSESSASLSTARNQARKMVANAMARLKRFGNQLSWYV